MTVAYRERLVAEYERAAEDFALLLAQKLIAQIQDDSHFYHFWHTWARDGTK